MKIAHCFYYFFFFGQMCTQMHTCSVRCSTIYSNQIQQHLEMALQLESKFMWSPSQMCVRTLQTTKANSHFSFHFIMYAMRCNAIQNNRSLSCICTVCLAVKQKSLMYACHLPSSPLLLFFLFVRPFSTKFLKCNRLKSVNMPNVISVTWSGFCDCEISSLWNFHLECDCFSLFHHNLSINVQLCK